MIGFSLILYISKSSASEETKWAAANEEWRAANEPRLAALESEVADQATRLD